MQTAIFMRSQPRSPRRSRRSRKKKTQYSCPSIPSCPSCFGFLSRLVSLEEQCSVRPAEAEGVREGVIDLPLAALVRYVVQIALGIRVVEIDGRRHFLVVHGQCRNAGLKAAGG